MTFLKRYFVLLLTVVLFLIVAVPALAAPKVVIDGQQYAFDVPPIIVEGRTLVPFRAIFEAFEADVNWDAPTQTVTATKGDNRVKLQIGVKTAHVGGFPTELDVPARIVNGRTMVPLRFVSMAMGACVNWNSGTQTVTITTQ